MSKATMDRLRGYVLDAILSGRAVKVTFHPKKGTVTINGVEHAEYLAALQALRQ